MKNQKNDKNLTKSDQSEKDKKDKEDKKSQKPLGTTKPNGVVKSTNLTARSVKYRMRDYLVLRKERAKQETRKLKISSHRRALGASIQAFLDQQLGTSI
jgi:hypothetical protein